MSGVLGYDAQWDPHAVCVIVCGGRDLAIDRESWDVLGQALTTERATIVRHGANPRGGDRLAQLVAEERGLHIDPMPARWDTYGYAAGPKRNAAMLAKKPHPVAVIALPGGRGTEDMKKRARAAGVRVIEIGGRQ